MSVHWGGTYLGWGGWIPTLASRVPTLTRGCLSWLGVPTSARGYLPGWGYPPSQSRYPSGQGGYPLPPETEQHSEYLPRGRWYASCGHAGGLSCFSYNIIDGDVYDIDDPCIKYNCYSFELRENSACSTLDAKFNSL